jgi:hypothetical protein
VCVLSGAMFLIGFPNHHRSQRFRVVQLVHNGKKKRLILNRIK